MVAAAGFVRQAQLHTGSNYVAGILGPAVVFSIDVGRLLNTPVTAAVTVGVAGADAGAAAGLMTTTKEIGAALGLAVLITVAAPGGLEGYNRAFTAITVAMVAAAAATVLLPAHRDTADPGR